ncbi:MAG: CapA family protein [Nannocystaceae bacterium]|nr:CapA family protein [bacterium]
MAARSVLACLSFLVAAACSRPQAEVPPVEAATAPAAEPSPSSEPAPRAVEEAPGDAAPEVAPTEPTEPLPEPKPPKSDALTLTFVGDIIFGRYRETGFDPIPEDGYAVFEPMGAALRSDMLIGNLETPLVYELPPTSPIGSKFAFGASKEHAQLLVDGGFSAVSLANNHWYDQRLAGVEQTPKILEELGIVPLGAPTHDDVFRVQPVEAKGWRVGVLAFTNRSNAPQRDDAPTLPFLSAREVPDTLAPIIEAAREDYDVLVGFVHWGEEYEDGPSGAQKKAAHALIDAGADLVIAHHPHVLQGVELYGEGLIMYSLGNFLFENTNDPARLTGVLRVTMREGCREEVRFHPAYVKRLPVQHPVPASGYMGRKVRERLRFVSRRFGSVWEDVEVEDRIDMTLKDTKGCSPG